MHTTQGETPESNTVFPFGDWRAVPGTLVAMESPGSTAKRSYHAQHAGEGVGRPVDSGAAPFTRGSTLEEPPYNSKDGFRRRQVLQRYNFTRAPPMPCLLSMSGRQAHSPLTSNQDDRGGGGGEHVRWAWTTSFSRHFLLDIPKSNPPDMSLCQVRLRTTILPTAHVCCPCVLTESSVWLP
jgi:hypothetical protein